MCLFKLHRAFPGLILASVAGHIHAEPMLTAAATTMEAPVRAQDWQRDLDLQHWGSATFHADLSSAIIALSAAHGATKCAVMLDIAELYLTHMLLYEARTTLEGITPVTPDQARRLRVLKNATSLLSGQAVEDFTGSALNATNRPDRAFWAALQAIAHADAGMLSANIRGSFSGLGLQSRAALRQMLPVFIEAATELGEQAHAAAGLKLLAELPDLADSSTGQFLRGRVEERRGNNASALKAYFLAAEGWDEYAARARLAVADMSLRDGGSGALLSAQSILQDGAEAWRGDRYELEILKRMARLYAGTGDKTEELLALGRLLKRFPTSSEAKGGQEQAKQLLNDLYQEGRSGSYPLSEWMSAHLRLLPFFGAFPEFPAHTEALADYVLGLGATDLAAKEYLRAIHEYSTRDSQTHKSDVTRLTLKLADAQRQAGLLPQARATLEAMKLETVDPQHDAHATLAAKVLSELNDGPALMQTTLTAPTPDHLRDLGMALSDAEEWGEATATFLQLWKDHPYEFAFEDATRLLIAANRSNNSAAISKVARAFPQLTSSAALIDLAKSLNATPQSLMPLSAEKVADRLQSLDDAFQTIKNTSVSP